MTHRLFSVGATVAAVILAAAFTMAQGPGGPDQSSGPPSVQGQPPPGPGGRGRGLAALDLTEDQRTKIADIRRATREQVEPLQQQIADLHRKTRAAIADLLTPDQRETMRLMEGRRGGQGRGPGRPGPGRGRGGNAGPGQGPRVLE